MTPGNNGASTPEDDDPFGYLYADGQARGAQPPTGGYGYPNAVNRVRTVGERQYGQQPAQAPHHLGQGQTAAYGQVPQQGAYGQPHQSAETGGAPATRQTAYGAGGGRRGPNTRGLLIGAIAVVAAVVIGIGVAVLGGDDSEEPSGNTGTDSAPSAEQRTRLPRTSPSESAAELPKIDAKALLLEGGAAAASDISGAKADGGVYVTGFNAVGASVTWTVHGIPDKDEYRLYVDYGVPGKDANATLTVNGTAQTRLLNMKNFANATEGDYAKGWTETWATVQLNKGTNTIRISCEQGNQCDVNLDRLYLVHG